MINLCIPHVVLEPIMSKLSAHQWFISEKKRVFQRKWMLLAACKQGQASDCCRAGRFTAYRVRILRIERRRRHLIKQADA